MDEYLHQILADLYLSAFGCLQKSIPLVSGGGIPATEKITYVNLGHRRLWCYELPRVNKIMMRKKTI